MDPYSSCPKGKMQRDNRSRSVNSVRSPTSNSSDVDTSEFEDNSDDFSQDSDDNDNLRTEDDSQVIDRFIWQK